MLTVQKVIKIVLSNVTEALNKPQKHIQVQCVPVQLKFVVLLLE